MTIDILSLSATGLPVRTGVNMLGMAGPGFSTQQLNRYRIARVHSFNFDGNID
jgi:hypothetical protein